MAKLIKKESEYEETLLRIEELMDAEPGSAEAEELELLAALVELYEERTFPIEDPTPVEALRFRMDQAGLSQKDLVAFIGSPGKVSEILNEKRSLSLRMIRRLHSGLGIPADVLLQEPPLPADASDHDYAKFPVREMALRGWFGGRGPEEATEYAEELVGGLLQSLSRSIPQGALLRQHVRAGAQMDPHALMMWQARVVELADRVDVGAYRPGSISDAFVRKLVALSCLDEGPRLVQEMVAKRGVALVILAHLPRTHLDGAAMVTVSGKAIIALTLRYDRLDNFWFTLCHELAHLALHLSSPGAFLDDLKSESVDELERQADSAAAEWLIPGDLWAQFSAGGALNSARVKRFARESAIHPAIIAGRVRRDSGDYRSLSKLVGSGAVRRIFADYKRGWPIGSQEG